MTELPFPIVPDSKRIACISNQWAYRQNETAIWYEISPMMIPTAAAIAAAEWQALHLRLVSEYMGGFVTLEAQKEIETAKTNTRACLKAGGYIQ